MPSEGRTFSLTDLRNRVIEVYLPDDAEVDTLIRYPNPPNVGASGLWMTVSPANAEWFRRGMEAGRKRKINTRPEAEEEG